MAIFVTGLTGGAVEENDITMKLISGSSWNLFGDKGGIRSTTVWDMVINENINDLRYMFYENYYFGGTILLNAYVRWYTSCFFETAEFSDVPLVVNYTSLCTNIDSIIATGDYVSKGVLVV